MNSQRPYFTWSFALPINSRHDVLAGCSSSGTRVSPNVHFQEVGEEQAEKDIVACEKLADDQVPPSNAGEHVAGQTATGAAIGAAGGAVIGLLTGDAGIGAAFGAAAGAAQGFVRGLFGAASSEPNPAYQNFVNRCLKEAGYEPTG
ncbi:MAG: hypothetical protein KC587_06375 [Nitrospira sp.]|nr:hypothetical protein [Nitrospira sp.]